MPYSARHIEIEGKEYPYFNQLVWPEIATTPGLPATAMPIGRSEAVLPIGVQIVGPYLEDRTTIAFAEMMERAFGGFIPPPRICWLRITHRSNQVSTNHCSLWVAIDIVPSGTVHGAGAAVTDYAGNLQSWAAA